MKRIISVLIITCVILAGTWIFVPPVLVPKQTVVSVVSPLVKTVYDSVVCNGTIVSKYTERLCVGTPSEITAVYAYEGMRVKAGDLLLRYSPISDTTASGGLSGLVYSEIASFFDSLSGGTDNNDILSAAEVFARTGELPAYFKDYYMPDQTSGARNGRLYSTISGTVTMLNCSIGDKVSGVFTSVVVTDDESLRAEVMIPEQYLSRVKIGQKVNITCTALGGAVYPGYVDEIAPYAVTSGGLITKKETYVKATVSINNTGGMIPGLQTRARIFCTEYENALIIPFCAVWQEDDGGEYAYIYENGIIVKKSITPVYENDDGIIVKIGFKEGDLLVENPTDILSDGMAVELASAESGQ